MKPQFPSIRLAIRRRGERGFALVIVLSLMILLALLAVGLLTISSVSLRSASQGESMARAKANARLAMMLALGELQRTTGTDRAITAPAAAVSEKQPLGLTGAWEAWDVDQKSMDAAEADKKFHRWLVSSPSREAVLQPSQPPPTSPDSVKDAVMLLGDGSLRTRKERLQDDQRIALEPSVMSINGQQGRFAWAVIDESVKSRVDLFHDPASVRAGGNIARTGAPPTDGAKVLSGWNRYEVTAETDGKLVTTGTLPLSEMVSIEDAAIYNPDVTVCSRSLMTDPVSGGLKKDLSLLSSRALSSDEAKLRLYQSSGAITDNVPSDPYLSLLTNYHQLYKRLGMRDGTLRPGPMQVAAKLPSRHTPYTPDGNNIRITRAAHTEPLLVPSVLRVDIIFSMIARRSHGGWTNHYGTERPYLLHLQYLPVVTLHNPYSVPLVIEGMKVTFKNLPVGFNFRVDNQPLSTRLVALNQMYVHYAGHDSNSKDFGINLKPSATSSGVTSLVLEPGQTKLFGTPKVPPTWTWFNESPGTGADGTHLFDWRSNHTANFDMGPMMITPPTGGGAGFDIDWINPQPLQTDKGKETAKGNVGMVGLRGTESLGVEFGPYTPTAGNGAFTMTIDLLRNGTETRAGAIEVKYGDQARLKEILEKGKSVRFPETRRFPELFPKPSVDPGITVTSIYEEGDRPIKDYVKSKQFMIFSLASKTTKESFVPARPLLAGNPVARVATIDLTKNKDPEGGVPLELVMMPIRAGRAAIEEIRRDAAGKDLAEGFFFGGNGSLNGSPRATLYEYPVIPPQSLAQFRHADLAGSGFMPFTLYTAGESMAHPLVGTGVTRRNWTDGTVMLDHAYLANRALWDRYFLSTVADQEGPFFPKKKPYGTVLTEFFEEGSKLPNARFTPFNRGSTTVPAGLSAGPSGSTTYENIAAYLMLEGGFNINSASEHAWKSVLACLTDAEIETVLETEAAATDRYPIPRVRRPSEKSIDSEPIATHQRRWQGYRRLTKSQVESLAKQIVIAIRERGPFLSMADFVNRGIGEESSGGDLVVKGTIQAAIDQTDINKAVNDAEGIELAAGDVTLNGYKSILAGTGNNAVFSPGVISQGDVLSLIGSRIAARGDTFRIRAYGEARDATGRQILAKAWCEVVVQRVTDFVDATNQPTTKFNELTLANQRFGRRYEIVSFRWLDRTEV